MSKFGSQIEVDQKMFVTGKYRIFVWPISNFAFYYKIIFYYKIQIMLGPENFRTGSKIPTFSQN